MITNSEFKHLLVKGAHPHQPIRKSATAIGVADTGNRTLRFVVSTGDVDRDLDRIDQNGWDLSLYRLNPLVLLFHDQKNWPIGKALDIDVVDGQLIATVEFVPEAVPLAGPIAECAYQLCKSGFLSAVSVGFTPLTYEISDDPSRSRNGVYPGVDHHTQSLLEFSIVTVPGNGSALMIDEPVAPTVAETVTMSANTGVEKAKRSRVMAAALLR